MEKILSLIIPSYNMEKYLEYCLDSLLIKDNFEILEVLVINDGSRDRTLEIAKRYEARYPEVFRVIDKPNGNYGSCINRGLKEATGKYVKVLDADDSFDTDNFNEFVKFLQTHDADLILSDYEIVDANRVPQRILSYNLPIDGVRDFNEICVNSIFVDEIQMHAVTYRRDLFRMLGYHQTEGISYTDQQWIFTPMIGVKSVAYLDKVVYKYLVGREGQTMAPEVKLRSMEHAKKNSFGLVKDYETHKKDISNSMVKKYLFSRLSWYIKDIYIFYITNYDKISCENLREYDCILKDLSPEIYAMIGSKDVSSIKGFPYIDYWRKHVIPPLMVRAAGLSYKWLLNAKIKSKSLFRNRFCGS